MSETNSGPSPIIWRRGKSTILRPIEEGDIPFFRQKINDVESQKYLIVSWPLSEIDQRNWYERAAKHDPNHISVAVCTLAGELIGNMSIRFDPTKQSAVTGTLIGSAEHRGKGYGTDAKMQLLDYAFNWRGVRKVESRIIGYNIRSRRYAKACGYHFTARIPGEHFRFGKWRSEVIYTAWRDEWLKLWKKYNQT